MDKNSSSPVSPASASSSSSGDGGYTITNSGINSQGNHYCSRDHGPNVTNPNSYHYSNVDGSYYYSNPNGSNYYNDGNGNSRYTPGN
ncbi:hypothetical protein P280DRAFT_493321 [Massarina eburnea CBS 473.64]|uniref:Uncharacterized protein n=1 Tax=Massarina eburnea CBS 473.64 TaxID=1395130 RepID=A0A6A6RM52_9PLEO|nr:hypothetical protein P280DRAFT_493321 [Massarina eburnea CBS 473.64]